MPAAAVEATTTDGQLDALGGVVIVAQLLAQRDGNNLTLSWPESTSAHLERPGSPSQPVSWTTVTNQVTIAGVQKRVTITPIGSSGYYRLVLE